MKTFTFALIAVILAVLAFTVEADKKPCKEAEGDAAEGNLMSSMKDCISGLKGGDMQAGFATCKTQLKSMFKGCAGKSKIFQKLQQGFTKLASGVGAGGAAGLSKIKDGLGQLFTKAQGSFSKWSKNKGAGGAGANAIEYSDS